MPVPLAINHVGITVPDVFAAIDWYTDVFSMSVLLAPRVLEPGTHAEAASALGPRFRKAWQAHLLAGNGVGVEVFQFIDPPPEPAGHEVPFTRRGAWHICLTHPDPRQVTDAVRRNGGTVLSEPAVFVPGRPWLLAYVGDPWGVVWEVMSASYAEAFGNWPQPGQTQPPVFANRPTAPQPATTEGESQ